MNKKHKFVEYLNILKENNQIKEISNCDEILQKEVENMSYNSNETDRNSLFICKGASFKEQYLNSAIKQGAFAYISTSKYNVDTPCIIVEDIYTSLSLLSKLYFNNSDENINIVGITGTKGKSTTAYYTKYILDEYSKQNLKKDTAILSSIDIYDGIENFESHITTPESYDLFKHFQNATACGMENIVMEVSSQALKYSRVNDVTFDIGVFLNISEDHISNIEHENFEDYFESKLKIFKKCKTSCVNLDCENADIILNRAKNDCSRVYTFSKEDNTADFYAYNIHKDGFDTVFNVKTPTYDKEFILTMPGLFNVENALASISISYLMNIEYKYIYDGLKKARSSGRMELYFSKDKKILALVDYAHNKLSFEKLYDSVKNEYKGRRIVTIFGCPGKKAFIRRRDLGLLAGENSDKVYLVAEDPGYEPVEQISKEIAKYVEEYTTNYEMIEDRGEAIKKAVEEAAGINSETILLITGKGNETRQKYGSEYLPCKSDVEYITMYLKEYDSKMEANK